MNEIELNAAELRLARFLAQSRYSENRALGVTDKLHSGGDPIEKDMLGISGELAFCKLFNCYPDLSTTLKPKSNRSNKGDCYLHNVGFVDVKTRQRLGDLTFRAPAKPSGDWFALMYGSGTRFRFLGAIPQSEVLQPENIKELSWGLFYVYPRAKLRQYFHLVAG